MNKLKSLYVDLIKCLADKRDKYPERNLTIFSASAGKNYTGNIMIVGRAVNRWRHDLNPSSESSAQEECISSLHNALETENLNWVKEQWGNRNKKYNTRKSAFWRVAKSVSAYCHPDENFHTDAIVWTNLYKATKASGGNPSEQLMNVEFEICQQIFDAEIDLFKPRYIVFLTGLAWACDFVSLDDRQNKVPGRKYVVQTGTYKGSRYIIGQHPQGKNEAAHLKEIAEYIDLGI